MTVTISSRILRLVANQLRAGRHPLVVGNVGDLVMLQGEPVRLVDALVRQAISAFEVVVLVNAVDGIEVVYGGEAFDRISDTGERNDGQDEPTTERERRLQAIARGVDHDDPVATIRCCLTQRDVGVLVLVEQADILLQDPAHHDEVDRDRVANLQLGLRGAARVGRYRNTCVLLAGDGNAVPPVLLAGSDAVGIVEVPAPSKPERVAFLDTVVRTLPDGDSLNSTARASIVEHLAVLTEGETLEHLESLAAFARASRRSVTEPRALVNLHRLGDRPDYWGQLIPRLPDCFSLLRRRVFGQDHAVEAAMGVIAAGALGLRFSGDEFSGEGLPRGVLWFVGPTGVGKTELAKAIAEAVFGDAEAYVRLDMSTFAQEHAAERLMGSPPGFVGYEQGGELTNAVRQRPNSVVLLDEIEKAHPRALDRFMSIFDDGRVTDAQGRVTYFNETVIIATSNLGASAIAEVVAARGEAVSADDVAVISRSAVRDHFTAIGRPEILGRIEAGIVPFDILRAPVIDQIATKFVSAARLDNGPRLDIDVDSARALAQQELRNPAARALGGRQVRNILQERLRDLTMWIALRGHAGAESIVVQFDGAKTLASVDGAPTEAVDLSAPAPLDPLHGNHIHQE